jgi:hypothetical protein
MLAALAKATARGRPKAPGHKAPIATIARLARGLRDALVEDLSPESWHAVITALERGELWVVENIMLGTAEESLRADWADRFVAALGDTYTAAANAELARVGYRGRVELYQKGRKLRDTLDPANIQTRGVDAGAYASREHLEEALTHSYDVVAGRPLCNRVKNINDFPYPPMEPPTCEICLSRDPRFNAEQVTAEREAKEPTNPLESRLQRDTGAVTNIESLPEMKRFALARGLSMTGTTFKLTPQVKNDSKFDRAWQLTDAEGRTVWVHNRIGKEPQLVFVEQPPKAEQPKVETVVPTPAVELPPAVAPVQAPAVPPLRVGNTTPTAPPFVAPLETAAPAQPPPPPAATSGGEPPKPKKPPRTKNRFPGVPHSDEFIRERAASLVVQVSRDQRQAIRDAIQTRYTRERRPETLVRDLRNTVGLDPRRARALRTFEDKLRESGAKNVSAQVDRYREKLLQNRAETIARTESVAVENQARMEAWDIAMDAGELPADAEQEWVSTGEACPRCQELDGVRVPVGEAFPSSLGPALPPLHPNCYCTCHQRSMSCFVESRS